MEQTYIQQIQSFTNPSFQKILDTAKNNCGISCPGKQDCKPWKALDHGVRLLDTHEELCKYLCSYGDMHEEKMSVAFNSIKQPQNIFNQDFTIIDWGCGQGLATLCFFDFLNQKQLPNRTHKVVLIEPSVSALNRAKLHVSAYLKDTGNIILKNKSIDEVEESDLQSETPIVLHFFSNILDIPNIDLEKLSNLISQNIVGEHYFFCVGPLNSTSTQIENFAKHLNIADEQVIGANQGQLINKRGTIKLLVFKIIGKVIEVIKTDFYPPVSNNINYILMLEKILSKIDANGLTQIDKIIQFYKTVIELEQCKEPEIKTFFQYPISEIKSDVISLDLQMNKDFYQEFKKNSDGTITRWPKDLFVGLKATLGEKSYLLMSYIIPYDDIKDIDFNTQRIHCKLSDFSFNPNFIKNDKITALGDENKNVLSKINFELSDEQLSEIENACKEATSIEELSTLFKSKVDEDIVLNDILFVALSSKNSTLLQIHSELKKLSSNMVYQGSLLESFLLNRKIDSQINDIQEEDIIQISDIDDSQKKAVLNAFNNKLSVITGPPGSGKTQVILNILANAVVQNKKVLVASKNNKAVDNVKDRFDRIDDFGFFLRFGSKKVLSDITIPAIDSIINQQMQLEDNIQVLDELKNKITFYKQIIKENKSLLAKRNDLLNLLPSKELKIQAFEKEINNLTANNSEIDFFRKFFNWSIIDAYNVFLKTEKNNIESKYSGIGKIFFNLFSKQKYARVILNTIEQYPFEIRNYLQTKNLKSKLLEFRKGDDIIQLYSQLITLFSKVIAYIQDYLQLDNDLNNLKSELIVIKSTIDEVTANEVTILSEIENGKQEIGKLGKPLLIEIIKNKIKNSPTSIIYNYKQYLPDNIPYRYDEIDYFIKTTKLFLDIFNITSVTSLSAKAAFPLENELFDIVVIDEASQCDIASAIPLILRAKQLVVIGDPMQLKHISMVNEYEEVFIKEHLLVSNCTFLHYNNKSLWDYSRGLLALTTTPNNVPLMIDRHYRCHPHIIGYSNETFYTNMLHSQIIVCTTDAQFKIDPKGIIWIDIQGQQRASNININDAEVFKSIEIATNLASIHKNISIGIVTPFRNQAEQLNASIPNQYRDRIIADTVYKFQGDEKDVVIYSLVVTNNSPSSKINWIDSSVPNLVNVAVTRAKNTLYIVGNKEYIRRNSSTTKPLGKLVQYVERTKKE